MGNEATTQQAIEEILSDIIDEWYRNVSNFYVTAEQLAARPDLKREEELKRFHDEKGHRIKFSKGDLDFTYGLRSHWRDGDFVIEVSVNNKVENFDYADFQERLLAHYRKTGDEKVPAPEQLNSIACRELFEFKPSFREAFLVEGRESGADIMRLFFHVRKEFLDILAKHPGTSRHLIETYCVSPFRSVYATVYRRTSR